MAGQPSPDVVLCGSAALRWDRSRHSAAQYGNTGCTQQDVSSGLVFLTWSRLCRPGLNGDGSPCSPVACLQPKHR